MSAGKSAGQRASQEVEVDGPEYHRVYRSGRPGWGWNLGGIALLAVLFLIVDVVLVVQGFSLYYSATGLSADEVTDKVRALTDTGNTTPETLLFLNLVIALAIPAAWLCTKVFHDLPPRWLASVRPRIRWRWLAASFGTAFVTFVVTIVLGLLIPVSGESGAGAGELNDFTSTTRDFILVIVLLTPLQAIGEEYAFRGYLTQAFGGLVDDARIARPLAVVAPAVLFALAHGVGQDFPVFVDRLAFGLVAGILVIATGGLEAGIAYHVLNNFLAYGFALAFGDMTTVLEPQGGGWWDVLLSVVKSVIFVALSIRVARALGVTTRASRTELVASTGRV